VGKGFNFEKAAQDLLFMSAYKTIYTESKRKWGIKN